MAAGAWLWSHAASPDLNAADGGAGWTAAVEIPPRDEFTYTLPGAVITNANSFTIEAGGLAAFDSLGPEGYSTGDTLFYRYETVTGDFDKRIRLLSLTTDPEATEFSDRMARAGLMVRESTEPDAATLEIAAANPIANDFVRVAGRGLARQLYAQSLSRNYPGVSANLPNQWLRIRRVGNAFAFYVGTDGTSWSLIAEQYQAFPETVLIGAFAAPDYIEGTSKAIAEFADYGDVVIEDNEAPRLVSVGTIDLRTIGVKFSEPVSSATATQASNYSLSQGSVVSARSGISGNTVYLTVEGLSSETFTVTVNGVTDLAGNAVAAGSTASGRKSNWISTDIGYIQNPESRPTPGDDPYLPGLAVAVSSDPNPEVEIIGGGSNAWNSGDFIHYLYREYTGDFDVAVAVERFDRRGFAGGYANAGIHVRAGLYRSDVTDIAENTKVANYVNVTYYEASGPNRAAIEIARLNDGEGYANSEPYDNNTEIAGLLGFFPDLRAIDAAGSISPQSSPTQAKWLRVTRVGDTFTSYFSYDGENWIEQANSARSMPNMPETVLVGFSDHNDSGAGAPPSNTYAGNGTLDEDGYPIQNESNYSVLRIRAFGDYPPPAAAPTISFARDEAGLTLTWTGSGFTLQQSTTPTGGWENSSLPVTTDGGVNTVTVTPTDEHQFFRLIRP